MNKHRFLRQYAYNEKLRTKVEKIIGMFLPFRNGCILFTKIDSAPSPEEIHAFPFIECMKQYRERIKDELVYEFIKIATEKEGIVDDDLLLREHWQFLTRQDGQDTLILVRTHDDYLNAFHLTWDLYLLELTQRRLFA